MKLAKRKRKEGEGEEIELVSGNTSETRALVGNTASDEHSTLVSEREGVPNNSSIRQVPPKAEIDENETKLQLETVEEEKEVRTENENRPRYFIEEYNESTLYVPSLPPSMLGREDSGNLPVEEGDEKGEVSTVPITIEAFETTNSTSRHSVSSSELGVNIFSGKL